MDVINRDSAQGGIFRAKLIDDNGTVKANIPGIVTSSGSGTKSTESYPEIQWCAYNKESTDLANAEDTMWIIFENGDIKRPVCISYTVVGMPPAPECPYKYGGLGISGGTWAGNGTGGSGSSGGSDNVSVNTDFKDGLTIADLQKCKSRKEYLELVMPIFKQYCANNHHGVVLKYPGVLALQPFFEVNANFPQALSNVAKQDNNLGGLKYSSKIPGASKGTKVPSNETGGCYCRFENISAYFYAQVWNATSSTYSLSHQHQSSVSDYANTFLNMWIGGKSGTGPYGYSTSLVSEYNKYGLSAYEN